MPAAKGYGASLELVRMMINTGVNPSCGDLDAIRTKCSPGKAAI
jgi:hypothetical protein